MQQVSLRAETGRVPGSRSSRRLRREGRVPAVVYGHDTKPMNVAVDARELYGALHTDAGTNALITLQVDGDEILTMARVVERHPFRSEYRHVDFLKISLTETITTEVPIHFEGEPVGVQEGGVFSPRRTSVQIEAVVTQIPGHIELDISGVELNESLRVSDLPEVEGVTYLEDPESVVMSVTVPAAEIEEPEPEVAEGELPEGEEVPEGEEAPEGDEAAESEGDGEEEA
ncbi:MAG TPA: 50S ribosomal protein L25 [Acidimicrobiia bacterium]|nr:50S ribosomal protein L25 [Acidimicrobiia bacterium]